MRVVLRGASEGTTPDMPSFESIKDMLGEEQDIIMVRVNSIKLDWLWNGTDPSPRWQDNRE